MTKKNRFLTLLFMFSIFLSACGTGAEADEDAASAVYTSVAATLTAAAEAATPTPTEAPTATPTQISTATLVPTGQTTLAVLSSAGTISQVSLCDASIYISDVTIPDGTVVSPGESFTKTWDIQNTGTCTWTSAYTIAYASGNSMSAADTALTESVSPGSTSSISIAMIAPTTAGSYLGYWKLKNASGTFFGSTVYVQIVVSSSTATTTSTPTSTSEATATSTAAAATSTPEPTTASTDTPEPTVETSTETTSS